MKNFHFFSLKAHFIFERKLLAPKIYILEHLLKNICCSNEICAPYDLSDKNIHFLPKDTDLGEFSTNSSKVEVINSVAHMKISNRTRQLLCPPQAGKNFKSPPPCHRRLK